jgi:hypothetical protein
MNLISDASAYSEDLRFRGFAILMVAAAAFIIVLAYLFVAPPDFLAHAKPAVALAALGALIVLFTLGLLLKGRGMLFKVPLKFYDEAVMVQPALGMRPVVIPYAEIASLELWWGLPYKKTARGCSVLSARQSVTSVEAFPDKESLRRMAEAVRPTLEQNGLKLSSAEEEAGSLHYTFHRDVGRRKARADVGAPANPWRAL